MKLDAATIKISLIIPVYNIEGYLEKCLDSILSQDMPEFEVIAVNDGSTDSSGLILERYAQKDSRINVVTVENGGQSWARNQGVQKANGQYIMFIDGDDFILPGCLSELYNYAQQKNADVVIFLCVPWQNEVFSKPPRYPYYLKNNLTGMDAFTATKSAILESDSGVCNKLIKRKFYAKENIQFKEGMIHEDVTASIMILSRATSVFFLDKPYYAYVQRNTSTTNKPITFQRIQDAVRAVELIEEELEIMGWKNKLSFVYESLYIRSLTWLLQICYSHPERYKSISEFESAKAFLEERFFKIPLSRIFSNSHLKSSYKLKSIRIKSGLYQLEKKAAKLLKGCL